MAGRTRGLMCAALLCAMAPGCGVTGGLVYSGSGSLTVSRAAPLLAGHVAIVKRCPAAVHWTRTQVVGVFVQEDPFEVLALGSGCVMDGTSYGADFRPDAGTICSLQFADGAHVLQVTDVALQYGPYGAYRGGVWSDPGVLQVEIGGDDVVTGARAVYHFSGTAVDEASVFPSCDDERVKHNAASGPRSFDANVGRP